MARPPLQETPTRDIGPYRLAHRIAVGGMAEVYRALWPQAAGGDRAVVIKRLLPTLVDDPEQRTMFDHEAALGLHIDHPNVVLALDHGLDEGTPYLVLEYVFGVDLWRLVRWLRRERRELSVPLAVWLGAEMLAGLAAVHGVRDEHGTHLHIVHRDVSPSNIFLSVHGDVKLGDLGIARAALYESQRRQGFRAKGKLGYLPPEQVAGRPVDQRGDVFSAAAVIAELLMGRPLFAGGTEIGVLLAIRDGDVSALRAVLPRLPAGLGQALLGALERTPERRIGSAMALRASLLPHVDQPVERLRAELGSLVVGAMDAEGEAEDRTSLAETIERDARFFETVTPSAPEPPDLRETGPLYQVERGSGRIGPFSHAELVRGITTGDVAATDRVSIDERDAETIANVPELARHLPPSTRTPTARRRTQMAETSELYDLGARSILAVLIGALLAKEDGLLLCEQGGVRKEVYLEEGVPIFVTSNQPAELLGAVLVAKGAIDAAELDMALALMPRFEGRLGETLVALGLMEPVQVFRHISEQVKDKLLGLFTWKSGHAALYRGVDRPERAFPLRIDPWDILLSGAARRVAAGLEDARFAGRSRDVLEPSGIDVDHLHLPDRVAVILTACQGPRSLGELEGLAADPVEGRAALLVLLELGALRWKTRGRRA